MFPRLLACLSLFFLLVPSQAAPPADGVIVFNEIMYNPAGTGEAAEWIELANLMGVSVDMSGWRIEAGINFTFPNGTVLPGGAQLVVAKTPASIPGSLGPFTGALANGGDTVRLVDRNDRLMDELNYGDGGDWPVGPDGSGVSLAKRDAALASSSATSWTMSAQTGGTPGAANFPPPPAPITTHPIALESTWKYNNSGAAPDPAWKDTAYAEPGWSSGQAGFKFGTATIYQPAPQQAPGGVWSVLAWSGDTDSGISSAKSYTHKIGLNRGGTYTAINGVTFDAPGAEVRSGATWSLVGADYSYTGNGVTQGANNLPAGSGSRQLCEDFFYGANFNSTSRLTITSLTPGASYTMCFYTTGFGGPGQRIMRITPSDSGVAFMVDENATDSGNGLIVKYHYVAPGNGTMTFDFSPFTPGNTWHHYAFSNEVAATANSEVESTGVTVADFSSQLTSGYTRAAVNTINNSGLTSGQHGTTPDGTMWLSNGIFAAPNDPLPAVITYDLGSAVHLTSVHVWNYNEVNFPARGARQVQVLVASTAGGEDFTLLGTYTFIKASGLATEPGQHIEIDQLNVRRVRFNILNNHGGDNEFAGLSEVKFYKQGIPSSTPLPYTAAISTLFNSGTGATGALLPPGQSDPHFTNVATGLAAVAMTPHPAWVGADGASQWIGFTGSGVDNVSAGQFTYRTTFDLSGYDATTADVKFFTAVDNSLDNVLVNGVSRGVATAGFGSMLGPLAIVGPFNAGANTIDFVWTNAGPGANPGGLRIKWDAKAAPLLTHTTLPANPIATYFRQHFTNSGSASSSYRVLLNYVADDGAVFYLNGQEIHRVNMPAGATTQLTSASSDVAYPMFSGVVEVSSSALAVGDNVLAVELHQAGAGNADAYFIAALDLIEQPAAPTAANALAFNELAAATAPTFFLELRNTSAATLALTGYSIRSSSGAQFTFGAGATLAAGALLSLDQTALGFRPLDGEKLFVVAPGGTSVADAAIVKNAAQARDANGRWLVPSAATPGTANTFSLNTAIVVNEIMYHHHPTFLATGTTSSPEEWVELFNRSGAAVDLTGWKLRGGPAFDFAPGTTIAAGAYLVVAKDPPALLAKFPGITVAGPLTGSLSNSDDTVRIEDANGNPANEVHYYSAGRWDERADGAGSSLELRNPNMDNSVAEAWTASNETAKSQWQTFSYSGNPVAPAGSNDPTQYNEFIFGLLNSGEFLIDDVSVLQGSNAQQCIQNGAFSAGDASTWRLLGTHGSHGRSVVVDDPASAGNKVLKVVATGPCEHMHNHCETTLKTGGSYVTINPTLPYAISFRARWLSGSPRLQSRLYFNRLARQHLLPMPDNNGTPGAANTAFVANPGPTFSNLNHSPALPEANGTATVRIAAADPQAVAQMNLKWRLDGLTWSTVAMSLVGDHFEGAIPGQAAGALVQFYVEGQDGSGAVATFPAAGAAARAMIRWQDGTTVPTAGHEFRILMATADADYMHSATNVMSNDGFPCTVVYRGREIFYDATVRLKSSERGRFGDPRLGFSVGFDPMHKFRGVLDSVNLDRSSYGRGTPGTGFGQSEIVNWHFFSRAGGVPSMFNDLVYLVAPRVQHTGSAMLTMAEFNDIYFDSQYANGANTPTFKYELIYYPTTTTGGVEGLKLAQPDLVNGVNIGSITAAEKEAYRWNFLIGNARDDDDYTRVINLAAAFRATGAAYNAALPAAIDIDQWLRASAAMALAGIDDNYSNNGQHNLKLYARADGRMLYLPWDPDFVTRPSNDPVANNTDLLNIINSNFAYKRAYYGHLLDIIGTSFNTTYLTSWVTHYQSFTTTGGNWNEITTYVADRAAFVTSAINTAYPPVSFSITTNGGADFSAPGPQVTLTGAGWVNVRTIRVQMGGLELLVTWTGDGTWQVTLPIAPGPNTITLEALDYQGNIVGTDTITITGTGSVVPAAAGNLVVSELHYHPVNPSASEQSAGFTDADDFEFIEVQNIGAATVNLNGVRFVGGIDYAFPATTLGPGGTLVVPRRATAFARRHPGVPVAPEYFQTGTNQLDNGGEELALIAATGADIVRFTYDDVFPWPTTPDGTGPSLVLIAPALNPNGNDPLNWRASAASDGNPNASDATAPPANPGSDGNGNGLADIVDYALGGGALPVAGSTLVATVPFPTFTFERDSRADVSWEIQTSANLQSWAAAGATLTPTARTPLGGGRERITLRGTAPLSGTPPQFLRARLRTQP